MQELRYSINVTLDGCVDHRVGHPDGELHQHAAATLAAADGLIFGRVVYQMMEQAWRPVAEGARPDWVEEWMVPFAETIHVAKKYVVSDTLEQVDWNAELIRPAELETTVRRLKAEDGRGLLTGGVRLGLALAELGLIDEYQFVVQPIIAGHGPTLFAGLRKPLELVATGSERFASGTVATRYRVKGR